MSRKTNRKGRTEPVEHFAKLTRALMETPAWRTLSTTAMALYPWLRLEWHGPQNNNNGRIRLSVRQAAKKLGVSNDTAARAFRDLQGKGFLVVTEPAHLGVEGAAKSPTFELTELPLPHSEPHVGRMLYRSWRKGQDLPVQKAAVHNPDGCNGKSRTLSRKPGRDVTEFRTNSTRLS